MNTGSYVDGKWYHPTGSSRLVKNTNPADTKDVIAEFPAATAKDVEKAIAGAKRAFESWSKTPAPTRGRVLARAAEIARRRKDEIARTMTREQGKVLKEARGEVDKGIACLEFNAGEGFRIQGKTLPCELKDVFTYTIRRPLGVVGLITPWNFPWAIPVWKVAPALVAGNTVVMKPAELTPATCALLVEVLEEAGLPPGCLQLVVGPGSEVGNAITASPDIKAVSFTGSNAIGYALYAQAAARGAKVTCELGGKNAVIVLPGADLDAVVPAVLNGAFGSTGQRCTATSRVLAHPDIMGQLTEAVVAGAKALKVGPGLDEASQMGPAVDKKQHAQDLMYVDVAKKEGARLLTGGGVPKGLDHGYFVEPTVFEGVRADHRLFKEEVFGPVLALTPIKDLSEGIKLANAVEYGLTCSLYSRDVNDVMRFVEEVETGMVHVNEPTVGGEAQLPFGGLKATGIGGREMSTDGLEFFTETKTVFINYTGKAERSFVR
jgi:acyl-CoA reductase-like NAD-dependent aldehyde dehydrogenase